MKKLTSILLMALALSAPATATPDPHRMGLSQGELQKLDSESERNWTKVHWASSARQAVSLAEADHKPILVFLVVSEFGNKSSCQV